MFQPLDTLQFPSDGGNLLKKYKELGCNYLEDITDEEVLNSEEWNDCLKCPCLTSAWDLCEKEEVLKVSTTVPALDKAFGNGFSPGKIIEFAGDTGSGKTQLCFLVCCNLLLKDLNSNVEITYVCTNNNFATQRIEDIVNNYSKLKTESSDERSQILQDVLNRINVIEVNKIEELIALPLFLEGFLNTHNIKLFIIDSIFIPLKSVLPQFRKQIIHRMFAHFRRIAADKFPIILTNNLTTRINKDGKAEMTPSLGENYFHLLNTRLMLQQFLRRIYKIKVIKSPECGDLEAVFTIS